MFAFAEPWFALKPTDCVAMKLFYAVLAFAVDSLQALLDFHFFRYFFVAFPTDQLHLPAPSDKGAIPSQGKKTYPEGSDLDSAQTSI